MDRTGPAMSTQTEHWPI